ncbi:hypothetical protein KF840_05215 [bacterium]|nr:hypothetical protein [bacterium]
MTVSPPRAVSLSLRRFAGPLADELAILSRPPDAGDDPLRQAESAYRALAEALAGAGVPLRALTSETLFLRDIRRDLPPALAARARAFAALGPVADAAPPVVIEQPPLAGGALEVAAAALLPRDGATWSVRDVAAAPACGCDGCARSAARVVRLGPQTALCSSNLYGAGGDLHAQATAMFEAAGRLLAQGGMGFRDVVRTWIHLRDIDRDYDALNRARRDFFRRQGIEVRPASTGVQGGPLPDAHDVSLTLQALQSTRPLAIAAVSTPTLNEAWSYGADFSRGLRVGDANKVALHVSGTASIDEAGRTAHVGDVAAQVERMLHNIATLLARQGTSFATLHAGVVYLKRRGDAAVVRAICRERGFDGFPCALVEAPLCRPELLCEAEAVALLPLPDPPA